MRLERGRTEGREESARDELRNSASPRSASRQMLARQAEEALTLGADVRVAEASNYRPGAAPSVPQPRQQQQAGPPQIPLLPARAGSPRHPHPSTHSPGAGALPCRLPLLPRRPMDRPQTQQVARRSLSVNRGFLRSFPGVLRLLQLLVGTGLWITIASNKYEGSSHFALFVAVFFWLLTLALYFLTLLDKQDWVPVLGGDRWLLTNMLHDILATCLYIVAAGILISKTEQYSYCNIESYKLWCPYLVYLLASVFAVLGSLLYLVSALYLSFKKCRGNESII